MTASTIPDGAEIRARIEEAGRREKAGQAYGAVGAALREIVNTARTDIFESDAPGDQASAEFALLMDAAISALIALATDDDPAQLAIAATGGYGRSVLAPYSDIDLLILHRGASEEALRARINPILYPLWDAGLTVGQGVHTPASALVLARQDLSVQTAFLEARHLAGNRGLFDDFAGRYEKFRREQRARFFQKKLAEMRERHELHERARYLAEPDLKEAKGGLRDVDTIGWLYRSHTGEDLFASDKARGLLTDDDLRSLTKARSLLLSIRAALQMLRGRADDRLSFDVQPALADALGYADRKNASAAERMLKHYFVNALEIGRLGRVFSARLEADYARIFDRAPRLLPAALSRDEIGSGINLRIKTNRLDFARPASARRHPVDWFRLFRAFGRRPDFDIHPDALALIAGNLPALTRDERNDADIAKIFLMTLMKSRDPARVLRLMSETGLLSKYIPLFATITGRIEYGLYRRYSIEEQCFLAIGVLADLTRGRLVDRFPLASAAAQRMKSDPALWLTVLLHEAGLSLREPSVARTERLVRRVSRRLGLDPNAVEATAFVASRPLLLARQSERRDLSEDRTITDFIERVGDVYRLDILLVMTVCRLSVLRGESWDTRARQQAAILHEAARAGLVDGADGLAEWRERRRAETMAILDADAKSPGAASALLEVLPKGVLTMTPAPMLQRAAALIDASSQERESTAVSVVDEEGAIEALVYARDRLGLIADLSGALASTGANVRALQAVTLDGGRILDAFTIAPPEDAPGEADAATHGVHADFIARLHTKLLQTARNKPRHAPNPSRRFGDRRFLFAVEPVVRIDDAGSDDCLIVEAEGRDRPGLLHALAASLSELGVIIRSAYIATYGERVVDVFYVQDAPGYKIANQRRIESIERRLMAVLRDEQA